MTRRQQPSSPARGQTPQDFAVGISVFLLTVAFAFAFVPSIFTPFSSDTPPGAAQQADRVASQMIDEYSTAGRDNWLDGDFQSEVLSEDSDGLADRFGLPELRDVNVTVFNVTDERNFTRIDATGASSEGFTTASVSRIVVIEGIPECNPDDPADGKVCRLVVEVW
jgi:hypothetical protein